MSQDLKLKKYSTTPASNVSSPPNGWPEGMAPSRVNDSAREMMARLREWYNDAQWINDGLTKSYVAATQFQIVGSDQTAKYSVGRRVEAIGSTTGTIYGTITASTFSANTTVTVAWDSGSLQNESLTISYNIVDLEAGDQNATANSIVVRDSNGDITGTASSAKYADLAEKYTHPKGLYSPGTVVVVCYHNEHEVEASTKAYDSRVCGVVSENPGFKLNSEGEGSYIALKGKVSVNAESDVFKGDLLVTGKARGIARGAPWYIRLFRPNTVFGRALTDSKDGKVLAII